MGPRGVGRVDARMMRMEALPVPSVVALPEDLLYWAYRAAHYVVFSVLDDPAMLALVFC